MSEPTHARILEAVEALQNDFKDHKQEFDDFRGKLEPLSEYADTLTDVAEAGRGVKAVYTVLKWISSLVGFIALIGGAMIAAKNGWFGGST